MRCPLLSRRVLSTAAILLLGFAVAIQAPVAAPPRIVLEDFPLPDGTVLRAAILEPRGPAAEPRPTLLVVPPGAQGADAVRSVLERYFATVGPARGWRIVCPAAPVREGFRGEGAGLLVATARRIVATMPVTGDRVHLAGVANGGRAAFSAALADPRIFASLFVLPGVPEPADAGRLEALAGLPVRLFVGEEDDSWAPAMRRTRGRLAAAGVDVALAVLPSHRSFIRPAGLARVFDELDALEARLSGGAGAPAGR